jgi:hypothetical protein
VFKHELGQPRKQDFWQKPEWLSQVRLSSHCEKLALDNQRTIVQWEKEQRLKGNRVESAPHDEDSIGVSVEHKQSSVDARLLWHQRILYRSPAVEV